MGPQSGASQPLTFFYSLFVLSRPSSWFSCWRISQMPQGVLGIKPHVKSIDLELDLPLDGTVTNNPFAGYCGCSEPVPAKYTGKQGLYLRRLSHRILPMSPPSHGRVAICESVSLTYLPTTLHSNSPVDRHQSRAPNLHNNDCWSYERVEPNDKTLQAHSTIMGSAQN